MPGEQSAESALDSATLEKALKNAADYINKKGGNLTIVAVGGAVNCMALRSRNTTHDFDFFNNNFGQQEYELITAAAMAAQKKDKKLETAWLNNRTIVFMPIDLRNSLTSEAIAQNELVFEASGLKVVAAPWNYAFCCKVDRLAGSGLLNARPYDLGDAAAYLKRYLASVGKNTSIPKAEVIGWMARFHLQRSAETTEFEGILAAVNRELGYKAIV